MMLMINIKRSLNGINKHTKKHMWICCVLRLNKKTIKISHQCLDALKIENLFGDLFSCRLSMLNSTGNFCRQNSSDFLKTNNKLDSLEVHGGNLMKLDKIAQLNNKIVLFDPVIWHAILWGWRRGTNIIIFICSMIINCWTEVIELDLIWGNQNSLELKLRLCCCQF